MEIKDFVKQLGIKKEPTANKDGYIIRFANSDEYAKVYSLLSKSELVDLKDGDVVLSEHSNVLFYESDEFDLILSADFDHDSYTLTIKQGEN